MGVFPCRRILRIERFLGSFDVESERRDIPVFAEEEKIKGEIRVLIRIKNPRGCACGFFSFLKRRVTLRSGSVDFDLVEPSVDIRRDFCMRAERQLKVIDSANFFASISNPVNGIVCKFFSDLVNLINSAEKRLHGNIPADRAMNVR